MDYFNIRDGGGDHSHRWVYPSGLSTVLDLETYKTLLFRKAGKMTFSHVNFEHDFSVCFDLGFKTFRGRG